MKLLFWSCLLLVLYIYIGYPLIIALLSRMRKLSAARDGELPSVTILIAAYNEERHIEATLRNKLALDYPRDRLEIIVVSDESTDATDAIVERVAAAADVPVRLYRQQPRQGKTAGLNLVVPMARGEIIVFSDANSIYAADTVRRLVGNFSDPGVGYVTGKMVYTNEDGSLVGDGCSSYMKYENWLRSMETRLGSVVGVDGGVDAMRRVLYEPLAAEQLPDFVQPLKVVEKGWRVVYEPLALLKEAALDDVAREYPMRVRVTLRALWALHDMRALLNPLRHGLFAFQLISHKLLRYLAFIPILLLIPGNILLLGRGEVYLVLLFGQMVFYLLALSGMLLASRPGNPFYVTAPYYFTLLNVACMHALWRYLKGEKQLLWTPRAG
jgi:cellulose synthase/poly-beta-1,6-N-acetylglucosamine synthase-like glycosyltransferase